MKFILLFVSFICSAVFAADLEIESVIIKDSGQPEWQDEHSGDYITEVKIRNTSTKPIQVQRYSVLTHFRITEGFDLGGGPKFGSDFYKYNSISCHPPMYDTIEPNEVHTIRYRDSSKHAGKEMFVKVKGKNGYIELGKYILKLTENG